MSSSIMNDSLIKFIFQALMCIYNANTVQPSWDIGTRFIFLSFASFVLKLDRCIKHLTQQTKVSGMPTLFRGVNYTIGTLL